MSSSSLDKQAVEVRRERDVKGKVLERIKGDGRTDRDRYRRGRTETWWDGQGEWKK